MIPVYVSDQDVHKGEKREMGGRGAQINRKPKTIPIVRDTDSVRAVKGGYRYQPEAWMESLLPVGNEGINDELINSDGPNDIINSDESVISGEDNIINTNSGYDENLVSEPENSEISVEDKDPQSVISELEVSQRKARVINDLKKSLLMKKGDRKGVNTAEEIEGGLNEIDKSMKDVKNWNFVPVPHQRQTSSGWRKFWTRVTSGIARVTKIITNTVSFPAAIYKRVRSGKRLKEETRGMQEAKQYEQIPGWDGAKFKKPLNEKGEDILMDERRVPTVWSYLTAGKAVDSNKQPLKPEVTLYIKQSNPGTTEHVTGEEMGHAMIGISYSRYSRITDRYERYNLKYGFYPAGGFSGISATTSMLRYGTRVPGQLRDDRDTEYSISRRYPASMEQVGRIVKASEKYAEDGYSYYSRNCSTFVRDMARAGRITASDSLFEEKEIELDAFAATANAFASGITTYSNANLRYDLIRYSHKRDLSYQNYGNKRVTQRDVEHFNESLESTDFFHKGYMPGEIGEAMRRQTDSGSSISSYQYAGTLGPKVSEITVNFATLKDELTREAGKLQTAIDGILSPQMLQNAPDNVKNFYRHLKVNSPGIINSLLLISRSRASDLPQEKQVAPHKVLSPDEIKDARIILAEELDITAKTYTEDFGNDARLNKPFMNFISIMQIAVSHLDDLYELSIQSDESLNEKGDLGNMAKVLMGDKKQIDVVLADGRTKNISISPSRYEAAIQVYDTPEAAMRNLTRYAILKNMEDTDGNLTADEKKELQRLTLEYNLIEEFDSSHRYMLERKTFSQQDINYVMKLKRKEKSAGRSVRMFSDDSSPSVLYQLLILEKIIGGMRDTLLKDPNNGGLPEEALLRMKDENDSSGLKEWLNNYLLSRIKKNRRQFSQVIKGLAQANNPIEKNRILLELQDMFISYCTHTFKNDRGDEKLALVKQWIAVSISDLFFDKTTFITYIMNMI